MHTHETRSLLVFIYIESGKVSERKQKEEKSRKPKRKWKKKKKKKQGRKKILLFPSQQPNSYFWYYSRLYSIVCTRKKHTCTWNGIRGPIDVYIHISIQKFKSSKLMMVDKSQGREYFRSFFFPDNSIVLFFCFSCLVCSSSIVSMGSVLLSLLFYFVSLLTIHFKVIKFQFPRINFVRRHMFPVYIDELNRKCDDKS